jgi:phosphate transport system protein
MGNSNFDAELAVISDLVLEMFGLVRAALPAATEALLADDVVSARAVIESDGKVDLLYARIEDQIQHCFALQAPLGSEMRYLISMLRVVPELERTGDLIKHIAERASRRLGSSLNPAIREIFADMGRVAAKLWEGAEESYVRRDPFLADRLRGRDTQLDDLHSICMSELIDAELSMPVSIEVALLARFYERIGDHAVNVANRIRYVSLGVGVLDYPGRSSNFPSSNLPS